MFASAVRNEDFQTLAVQHVAAPTSCRRRDTVKRLIPFVALAFLTACGTPPTPTDDPYESCSAGDNCSGGLTCAATTLPASTGYSGSFCTSTCMADTDCLQVPANYAANCVNGQCYLTCPSSDTCPDSQSCLTFSDQNGNPISLCTP